MLYEVQEVFSGNYLYNKPIYILADKPKDAAEIFITERKNSIGDNIAVRVFVEGKIKETRFLFWIKTKIEYCNKYYKYTIGLDSDGKKHLFFIGDFIKYENQDDNEEEDDED